MEIVSQQILKILSMATGIDIINSMDISASDQIEISPDTRGLSAVINNSILNARFYCPKFTIRNYSIRKMLDTSSSFKYTEIYPLYLCLLMLNMSIISH